ncbi:hypothetical protein KTD19_29385, partial [Burkholderia multivorans]|uniref:hypothetical protein n=1 Tax=Burkholderia multivorans TaxID=87883 RepID=UPI001C23D7C4
MKPRISVESGKSSTSKNCSFPESGNVPQTVEGWDGGCGIDYATLRSWSMLDFEGERFRAAASTQS